MDSAASLAELLHCYGSTHTVSGLCRWRSLLCGAVLLLRPCAPHCLGSGAARSIACRWCVPRGCVWDAHARAHHTHTHSRSLTRLRFGLCANDQQASIHESPLTQRRTNVYYDNLDRSSSILKIMAVTHRWIDTSTIRQISRKRMCMLLPLLCCSINSFSRRVGDGLCVDRSRRTCRFRRNAHLVASGVQGRDRLLVFLSRLQLR